MKKILLLAILVLNTLMMSSCNDSKTEAVEAKELTAMEVCETLIKDINDKYDVNINEVLSANKMGGNYHLVYCVLKGTKETLHFDEPVFLSVTYNTKNGRYEIK